MGRPQPTHLLGACRGRRHGSFSSAGSTSVQRGGTSCRVCRKKAVMYSRLVLLKVLLEASLRSCADAHSLTNLAHVTCTPGHDTVKQTGLAGIRSHQHNKCYRTVTAMGPIIWLVHLYSNIRFGVCWFDFELEAVDRHTTTGRKTGAALGCRKIPATQDKVCDPRTCTVATGLGNAC